MIYREWKQYMESCVLILQVAVNIFNNISSQTVLREVLSSSQGYNFLCSKSYPISLNFSLVDIFICF